MKSIRLIIPLLAVTLHLSAQSDTTQVLPQGAYGTTIGEEEMNNRDQSSNAIDVIRGRVAGMTVDKSGENAMSAVRLRGTVSLSGSNDPLIIVDGVIGDMSLLSTINPTDIESFRILKDASETAQFGSRGASGVIEVTTLKGSEGKLRIHYNGSFSAGAVYKTLPMLSAEAYRAFCQSQGLLYMDKGANTNWQNEISRTSFSHHHHLAFTGGTKQTTYRASVGYIDDQYVVKNTGSRSFIANVNLTQRMWGDILKIDIGMFGSLQQSKNLFNEQKMFYSAACFNPTYPAERNASGGWDGDPAASQIANPMAWLENSSQPSDAHLSTNLHLDFKLIEPLHLKLLAAYTYHRVDEALTAPTEEGGLAYRSTGKTHDVLANLVLDYNQSWGAHALSVLALAEINSNMSDAFHVTTYQSGATFLGADRLSGGSIRPWNGTDSYRIQANMLSFMGRVSYTILDRYNLTASLRTDGSSKFGANNKWGLFPSVSASWTISNEPWMPQTDVLDHLRLSGGYGLSGNQSAIDSYLTMLLYEPNGVAEVGGKGVTTYAALRNANPDLKWEVSHTGNVGVDLSLFKGRLVANVSYYNTLVTDMLYPYRVSTPPYTYPTLVANLGSMRNEGVEVSIGGTIVKTKDWKFSINANVTWQRNKLLSLSGRHGNEWLYAADYQAIASVSGAGSHGGDNDVVWQIVGQPLGTFYLPHCTGLEDNGKGGYTYGEGERYIAGQATPKVLLGSNISLKYKNFDLSIQINGAFGHKVFNGTYLAYMNLGSMPLYNVLAAAPAAKIYDQQVTDYWLERGDYINFDYITLGYQVPLPVNKVVETLRLVATMNNVGTISAYSGHTPIINSTNINSTIGVDDKRTYPLTHLFTFGLSIGF
jgi:TonB-linked SusC/RagA family outer membrane protein